jgi:hypothetical protein
MGQCRWMRCSNCRYQVGVSRWHVVLNGQECVKNLCDSCSTKLGAYRKGQKPVNTPDILNAPIQKINAHCVIEISYDDEPQPFRKVRGSIQKRLNSLLID